MVKLYINASNTCPSFFILSTLPCLQQNKSNALTSFNVNPLHRPRKSINFATWLRKEVTLTPTSETLNPSRTMAQYYKPIFFRKEAKIAEAYEAY